MKKTFSVLLALIMVLSCSLLTMGTAFAAGTDITFDTSGDFDIFNLDSGYTYTIPSGVTMTVPAGMTVNIGLNATLKVEKGGTLKINGTLNVSGNETGFGTLKVDGTVVNANNISVGQYGVAQALVSFPSLASVGLQDCIKVYYGTGATENEDLQSNFTWASVDDAGADLYLPINHYLFIKADIVKDGDNVNVKYDDSLMGVYYNRVEMAFANESRHTKILDAGEITYSNWDSDETFLKTYRISLTSGKGYTVIGRNGEEETVYLKYGKPFSFRVEIDENYQMSGTTMEVYIYNGYGVVNYNYNDPNQGTVRPSTPDASGYYTIPAVINDYTVYVSMLSIDDPTVTQIGSILQTIRSVFEMIINFFRQIANAFGIGG